MHAYFLTRGVWHSERLAHTPRGQLLSLQTSCDFDTMTVFYFPIRKNNNNNQESKFHFGSKMGPSRASLGAQL